jgi:hypothetical protein
MTARPELFFSVVLAFVSFALHGRAQDVAVRLRTSIPECALHQEGGSWVPQDFYPDGVLRFTYLYEPPKQNPGEYDYRDGSHNVYAAFWNRGRTKGELLQFLWLRRTTPIHLRIVNNGHIVARQQNIDIEDALWGAWTHEHLVRRLVKLKVAPLQTVRIHEVPAGGATCDSYAHIANNSDSASPPEQR